MRLGLCGRLFLSTAVIVFDYFSAVNLTQKLAIICFVFGRFQEFDITILLIFDDDFVDGALVIYDVPEVFQNLN